MYLIFRLRLNTAATPNLCSTQLGLDKHNASRSIKSLFKIEIYFIILSIKTFECDRENSEYIVFIFLLIYFAALCLSKPS